MPLIKPFRALRPAPGRAGEVIAPPYDVLSSGEARALAEGRPWSFLHISKPEIDLPPDTDPYDAAVYAKAAETMAAMIEAGVLVRDEAPAFYAWRLTAGTHSQLGVAVTASVAAYESNRIRKHEFTTPVKEDDRVRQIEAVNAETGPVMLAYPQAGEIDTLLAAAAARPADVDAVTAHDGVRHEIWVLKDRDTIDRLSAAFDALDALYITDGHHRSAAAARVSAARIAAGDDDPQASHRHFLAVAFPHDQLRILDYNRLVRDLNGLGSDAFLAAVAERFDVEPAPGPVRPDAPRRFGMYLAGQWYRLTIHPDRVPESDPVARLDIALLGDNLIAPILGITDPRRDERIAFVGGARGLDALAERVDSGEMAVAFSLYPTSMSDLMAVADAGAVMPPKSTWFEPKLADGLLSHVLD